MNFQYLPARAGINFLENLMRRMQCTGHEIKSSIRCAEESLVIA